MRGILKQVTAGVAGFVIVLAVAAPSHSAAPDTGVDQPIVVVETPNPEPGILASCSGSGCNNRDPNTQGCGGADAASPRYFNSGRMGISIRHSSTCRARWARVIIDGWASSGPPFQHGMQIRIQRQTMQALCGGVDEPPATDGAAIQQCGTWTTTHTYSRSVPRGGTGNYWTNMVQRTGGNERFRECYRYRLYDSGSESWAAWSCGSWVY